MAAAFGMVINTYFILFSVNFPFTAPEWANAQPFLGICFAPWEEESLRFINFLIFHDLIIAIGNKKTRLRYLILSYIFAHFIFYIGHYRRYDLFNFVTMYSVGFIMLILVAHLIWVNNYIIPLSLHMLNNFFVAFYGQISLTYTILLFIPYIITLPILFKRLVLLKKDKRSIQ